MKRLFCLFFLSAALVPTVCRAEDAPIAVVDVAKVISESIVGKAARNNVEAEAKKREQPLEKLRLELKSEGEGLAKQASVMSAEALKQKREKFQQKEEDFRRKIQEEQQEVVKRNNEEMGRVVSQIDEIVAQFAKEGGYRYVLENDRQTVLYARPDLDLTSKVIEALDAKSLG